jgi:hypothetical protein
VLSASRKKRFSRRGVWIGDTSVRHEDRGVLVRIFLWGEASGGSGLAW